MSTWHQDRARTTLYHPTLWTVVEDPPNQTRCLRTFETRAQAEAWRDNLKELHPTWSVYVLMPGEPKR